MPEVLDRVEAGSPHHLPAEAGKATEASALHLLFPSESCLWVGCPASSIQTVRATCYQDPQAIGCATLASFSQVNVAREGQDQSSRLDSVAPTPSQCRSSRWTVFPVGRVVMVPKAGPLRLCCCTRQASRPLRGIPKGLPGPPQQQSGQHNGDITQIEDEVNSKTLRGE